MGFHNSRALRGRKLEGTQYLRGHSHCIGSVIPNRECLRVFRAMAYEHTDVVQPGCGEQHIVIVDVAFSCLNGQGV